MNHSREFIGEYILENNKRFISKKTKTGKVVFNIISPKDLKTKVLILGYVKANKTQYTDKEYGTLFMYEGDKRYKFDVYSKKPSFTRTYGYIKVGEDEYLEVVKDVLALILIPLLLALIILCIIFLLSIDRRVEPLNHNTPSPQEKIKEDVDNGTDLNGEVILPEGLLEINGTITKPSEDHKKGNLYTGNVNIKVSINVNDEVHTLLETKAIINNGSLPDLYIDYTILDFELLPGVYYGTVYIDYSNGKVEEYSICIVIRQSTGGTVEINYDNEVEVNLNTKEISLSYTQGPSSNKTKIQVILIKDNEEYVLAESKELNPQETVKTLTLKDSISSKLQVGEYSGLLRVILINSDTTVANLNSDIDVTILVKQ